MRSRNLLTWITAVLLAGALSACDNKPAPVEKTVAAPAAPASVAPPVPDVGKVESVKVDADGYGPTAGDAVAQAMRLAVLQVNGASMDLSTVNAKLGLDVVSEETAVSIRADAFAESVRTRSGGVIRDFRVVSMDEPLLPGRRYKASIEANIAKFNPPADLKKIKVAVAPIRFPRATLSIGDRTIASDKVGLEVRQRVLDALVNTGRFAVLDRDFDPEVQQELDLIGSGAAPAAELAKLSQAASADLIWIGRVNELAYDRHSRQLRSSDRQLVSYSGGWSVSAKLVNVATRQLLASDTLRGVAPATEATTLGTGVDGNRILADMTNDLVGQVVASILARTFPISVVSVDGANVILSQGGQGVKTGARYAVVVLGGELKDPQTNQSLGRVESPCCQVVVDRVTPNLSYGHIEGATIALDRVSAGALQVREQLPQIASAKVGGADTASADRAARPARRGSRDAAPATAQGPPPGPKDEKW